MMRSWLNSLLSGSPVASIFPGMTTLAVGSLVARLVGILIYPVVTRIYTPADFGVFAIYTACILMIAPLLTLRYPVALPLPQSDGMAMNLVVLSGGIALAMSSLIGGALYLFGEPLFAWLDMAALAPWWWLVSVGALAAAAYEILAGWATRRRAYKIIASAQIRQSIGGAAVKVGAGLLWLGPLGLLLGQVVAEGGGSGRYLTAFWRDFRKNAVRVAWARLRLAARNYRSFPQYRLPSQLLLVFAMQAPLLFATALFDTKMTGQLGLALSVTGLPIVLLSQAVGNAYYAEIARMGKTQANEIRKLTQALQNRLFIIGILPTVILIFSGPSLFAFAFGEEWTPAGVYASILAFYLLLQVACAPLMQVFNVLESQRIFLILNMGRVTALILLFIACRALGVSPSTYVSAYSGTMVIFYLMTGGLVMWLLAGAAEAAGKKE